MRLWTIHPKMLDARGLVALWREGLLAQKVLRGETKGYRHHPQLARFRGVKNPLGAIASYLGVVQAEATARGYRFDATKIGTGRSRAKIDVTRGQLVYEWGHLLGKLKRRDVQRWKSCRGIEVPESHPMFRVVAGEVEEWERV